MIRFLLLLLFFALSLEALSSSETLKRADYYMQTKNQSNKFRAYNDYKNLYLRAVIEDDSDLKLRTLQGIVSSGRELNIDVSKYINELKKFTPADIEESKKESLAKQTYHKPTSKPMQASKKADEIHVQSLHKLESVKWNDEKLVITFDKNLDKNQISYFTIHKPSAKSYKYVIDVKSSMLIKFENISKRGIDRIKIAQYNPTTIRIVIQNSSKIDFKYEQESQNIVIDLNLDSSVREIVTTTPTRVDRNKTIVIDPGHGGKDPGAIGYKKYEEKEVVFTIANELEKILKSRGYKVFMTRNSDEFIKLSNRTKYANEKCADIFISVHANAVGNGSSDEVHGIECYFLSPSRSNRAKKVAAQENSADMSDMNIYGKDSYLNLLNHHNILASNKLAIDLQRGMLGLLNKKYDDIKDGGVREGPFWVLVGAQMPSVLVEVGFISHPKEATRLMDNNYRKTMAKGLADGIERYFANN
ncbi:MAG: N-acetylmuramoyl-L-alanine amidase [Sulfurimonas sp. RIFOXYD12_FULL_33_39]|uniref:N-acetylmuramoyl-L-alanine amidase n=1 Tax=unclassified Sulfurimonas TaxID=2623549 RepID=UPI0008ADDE9C|nr:MULTISPECIES: N-acetylmuramoyl-L-alanine amidase [unclassified Sulfurimonas]OHE10191.1 MAG: N-acetylmuramoyl-L-alanine amidase [Sulfurimonas sp. RIFOXYD12_FULL_33_39]OHE14588.1 MAG: N-acetylmuramoyl-L-alanine amidase [Sulfurimonas sp. RIFOXYD2_FULL_34_21]DAB28290.1 MAG TPA: N-acetylmuramoyl-L-alanine amidase [Sulfurimonas sp. UBA10385]